MTQPRPATLPTHEWPQSESEFLRKRSSVFPNVGVSTSWPKRAWRAVKNKRSRQSLKLVPPDTPVLRPLDRPPTPVRQPKRPAGAIKPAPPAFLAADTAATAKLGRECTHAQSFIFDTCRQFHLNSERPSSRRSTLRDQGQFQAAAVAASGLHGRCDGVLHQLVSLYAKLGCLLDLGALEPGACVLPTEQQTECQASAKDIKKSSVTALDTDVFASSEFGHFTGDASPDMTVQSSTSDLSKSPTAAAPVLADEPELTLLSTSTLPIDTDADADRARHSFSPAPSQPSTAPSSISSHSLPQPHSPSLPQSRSRSSTLSSTDEFHDALSPSTSFPSSFPSSSSAPSLHHTTHSRSSSTASTSPSLIDYDTSSATISDAVRVTLVSLSPLARLSPSPPPRAGDMSMLDDPCAANTKDSARDGDKTGAGTQLPAGYKQLSFVGGPNAKPTLIKEYAAVGGGGVGTGETRRSLLAPGFAFPSATAPEQA